MGLTLAELAVAIGADLRGDPERRIERVATLEGADPTSVSVDTFGTGKISNGKLIELIRKHFKLTPKGIITSLNLLRPIYKETARHGHFGRNDGSFTWEKTDKVEALRKDAGLEALKK